MTDHTRTGAALASVAPRPPSRFVRFVLVSVVAAAANFGARIVFSAWCSYPIAVALAFPVGLATAFLLNRRFVFRGAVNPVHRQASWFVIVNLAGLVQTLLVSIVLARWLLPLLGMRSHVEELAHAVGIAVPVVTSYFGHKWFSFRGSE